VSVYDHQKDMALRLENIEEIVNQIVQAEGQKAHEATVYFIDNDEMCRMHQEHFDDPSPTDCISFPMDDSSEEHYRILGEVFVCPKTAQRYALENQLDPYREATLYLVHGILHLLGYDDINEDDRLAMRAAEERHMQQIERKGLILRSV
jgi:probable rRNA maturation factor